MSDTDATGLLESMKQQLAQFIAQRDQAQINFQQLLGAIFACEALIKQHEDKLIAALKEQVEGEQNGQIDDQSPE